jgi:hypothetical protein
MYISRPTPKPETKPKSEECFIMIIDPDTPMDDTTTTIMPAELKKKIGAFDPLPAVVINEKTLVFRMDSRTMWTRYSLGMINYSVSSFGNLGSTPSVEKNLAKSAATIGEFFIPYYGMKSGNKIGSLLTVIANNGVKVVEAIKNKRDIAAYEIIWNKQIEELASYLNEINPSQYPVDLLTEQFSSLVKLWAEDFNARYTSDYITDSIALDNILKVAVSGIPNHVNKGYSSIADTLSRGIIAQFPLSFLG